LATHTNSLCEKIRQNYNFLLRGIQHLNMAPVAGQLHLFTYIDSFVIWQCFHIQRFLMPDCKFWSGHGINKHQQRKTNSRNNSKLQIKKSGI